MKITKQTTRIDTDIVDIICNKCGESLKPKDSDKYQSPTFCGLDEARVSGEWCSPHLEQGCYYSFSICEPCLFDFWKSFKIPVEVDDYRPRY